MQIYIVQPGDSLDGIAAAYAVSTEEIIYNNQLVYPYRLAVGQALLLGALDQPEYPREFISSGYAYPFIEQTVLDASLPYLSEICIFSYGFTASGALVYPETADEWLIAAALAEGCRPILTLTPFDESGNFNNYLISAMLNDAAARRRLCLELAMVMAAKGYQGVNVDFEYILAEDRDMFSLFVEELAVVMHDNGFSISVALVPKTYAEQPGLLYEGMDYVALGAAADLVLLMTYEWGYTYSEPMPIAPLDWVRRVLDYAVGEIAPDKILLGIPNYAYDWTLPYVKGETKARTMGIVDAIQQAADVGAEIFFDEAAQTPYYNYTQAGLEHEVWLEDVRSLQARFALVQEYGLAGGGWWQLMRLYRAGWLLLADTFYISKS